MIFSSDYWNQFPLHPSTQHQPQETLSEIFALKSWSGLERDRWKGAKATSCTARGVMVLCYSCYANGFWLDSPCRLFFFWITLIGGPAGWRAVFPNEKHEFSAGCTEDRRAGRKAAEKGGPAGYRKGWAGDPP